MDLVIDDRIYDETVAYIEISFIYGVVNQLKENSFYKQMHPRLKNNLILEVLKPYEEKFFFFFHDIMRGTLKDRYFIRKILSNLDCMIVSNYSVIIKTGDSVHYLYFI